MTDRTANRIVVAPTFRIPAGAEDLFVYEESNSRAPGYITDSTAAGGENTIASDTPQGQQPNILLQTPQDLAVIDQTIRRTAAGDATVDIIVQCGDVAGASQYEIQVTTL